MNRRSVVVVAVVFALAAGAVLVGVELFAPERATVVAESDTFGPDAEVLKTGTFVGKAGHSVSGTVSVVRDGDALYLHFEDYSQTQGPDVFVYVTPAADPDSTEEVYVGTKVLVDGGADGGESTKEGTFVQRLPDGVDPSTVNGVGIWCDRFSTPFGAATLTQPDQ